MIGFALPLAPILGALVILTRVGFFVAFMPVIGEIAPARVRALQPRWASTATDY